MYLTSPISAQATSHYWSDTAFVILDGSIEHLELLVDGLSEADVLVLDPQQDGVKQITEALRRRQSVSSVHIVSHGGSGSLQLGNAHLSLNTLDRYTSELEIWAEIVQGHDVLLYGCQVAQGALGHLFLQQLHQLTGANLAASTQRVGQVKAQPQWTLDAQVGEVETPVIFSRQLQSSYPGSFETVNFSISTNVLIESEGTPFSFLFSVDGPIPVSGSVVRLEGSIPQAINQLNLQALSFEGLAGLPVDVSPAMDFSVFELTINASEASVSLPVFNDFMDDSPQEITWTVTPVSAGTEVVNGSATFTIFDDPSEVPASVPVISLTSDITTLVEDEGTVVTFTISLSEPPPTSPFFVDIGTGKTLGLGDFDVLAATLPPESVQLVAVFPDNSGLTLNLLAPTATITLPIFDDQDRTEDGTQTDPDGPLRNDDIGEEQTTFSILPRDEGNYTISPTSGAVTLTLLDTSNSPPVADDDSYSTGFGAVLTVAAADGVLNGDTDVDDDPLTAAIASEPSNGAVMLNADGSFSYTPNAGFSGEDSFTYTVSDPSGENDTGTVTITVNESPNSAPVADDDSYSTGFDEKLTIAAADGVLDGDTDVDDDMLTAAIAMPPTNGIATLNSDGSFSYTPNAGFSGDDSFTYTASDGNGDFDTATVTVTVANAPEGASVIPGPVVNISQTADGSGNVSSLTYDPAPAGGADVTTTLGNDVLAAGTDAVFDNLVGFYIVTDRAGGIDTDGDGSVDLRPGDAGYAQAALSDPIPGLQIRAGSAGNPSLNTTTEEFGNVVLADGQLFAPFAIANGGGLTPAEFLAINPNNDAATAIDDPVAYFGYSAANPDGVSHFRALGNNTFGFEDLPSNIFSDMDFNDAVFTLEFAVVVA